MSFWILGDRNDGAILDAVPENGPEDWRYMESHHLAAEFPQNATMGFSPRFPDRRKLYDFVSNVLDMRIVSERVRRIVLELTPQNVEFLPVTLLNHQEEVAAQGYFIMNVLTRRDVIDLERSTVRMNAILKDEITSVNSLAIKKELEPTGPTIFRPVHLRIRTMVDDKVREAFEKAGLTGGRFFAADGWDGYVD